MAGAFQVIYSVQAGILGSYAAEMIFFIFKVAESMLEPSTRLYIYEAVCLQEVDSRHRCKYLEQYPEYEHLVQSTAAKYLMFYKILLNIPAVLLVLLCGAWSDKSGRKLPVMLTCFGGMVSVMMYMLSSRLGVGKGPFLPMVLLGAGIRGFCGRSAVMTMACHSYVADISNTENRTRKLAHLAAMSHFGYLTGCTIAGSLLDTSGFVTVFCVVLVLQAVCIAMASICMRETICTLPKVITDEKPDDIVGCKHRRSCAAYIQLRSCFRVLTRPRRGYTRCYLFLFILISCVQQTCKSGEMDMLMLFTQRAPLSWMRATYSYLLGVDYACLGFTAFFVLPILIRCLGLADTSLMVTGLLFKLCRTIMLAFSDRTWMVFTAISIGGPHAFTISALKSSISKLVETDEIGKAFSIISSTDTISNLFGTVIFTNVYAATLPIWTGSGFALESAMYLCIFILSAVLPCCITLDEDQQPLLKHSKSPPSVRKNYGTVDADSDNVTNHRSSCITIPDEIPDINIYDYDSQNQMRDE